MFSWTYEQWLDELYRPIMGADGEDDDDTAAVTETDEPEETEDDAAAGSAGGEGEGDSEGSGEEESDADEDEYERVRTERDRLRTQLAAAEAAARKAKSDARKAREDAAKKGGNWEAVAKEREAELQEANERAQEAETRAVTAEENLDQFRREVRITRLATKLSFRDTEDAIKQLRDQPESTGEDKACERALRKLAESKPYLIDQRKARGRAMENGGVEGMLTDEQLAQMSTDEINRMWDTGAVQKSLTARGPTRVGR